MCQPSLFLWWYSLWQPKLGCVLEQILIKTNQYCLVEQNHIWTVCPAFPEVNPDPIYQSKARLLEQPEDEDNHSNDTPPTDVLVWYFKQDSHCNNLQFKLRSLNSNINSGALKAEFSLYSFQDPGVIFFHTNCWNVLLVFIDKAEMSYQKIPKSPKNAQ